jgi:hypothetical protein
LGPIQNSLGSTSRRTSQERKKRLRKIFIVFKLNDNALGKITRREDRLREKRKISQFKIHSNLLTRSASTESKKVKKNLFWCVLCRPTFPWDRLHRKKKD